MKEMKSNMSPPSFLSLSPTLYLILFPFLSLFPLSPLLFSLFHSFSPPFFLLNKAVIDANKLLPVEIEMVARVEEFRAKAKDIILVGREREGGRGGGRGAKAKNIILVGREREREVREEGAANFFYLPLPLSLYFSLSL